jgi:ubiquinone/menaquinone biosynthesis C-methylase UbiE
MPDQESLKTSVDIVAAPWKASPYYADAEKYTFIWWDDRWPFKRMFERLDLASVLELACGHGRHSERVVKIAGKLTLMDVLSENIDFCKARIGSGPEFYINNGFDFMPVEDQALTAIFCYDAMVHFSPDLVLSYLIDAKRVLKTGGMMLLHHSNYSATPAEHYGQHPSARNYMPRLLFQKLANDAGLAILESTTFQWGDVADLDCLSLLQKV